MTATYRTYADLASVLTRRFAPDIVSNINRATPIFSIVPIKPATQDQVKWVAKFGTARTGTAVLADGADVTEYSADTKVPASIAVGTYQEAFGVNGKAIAAARASGNPEQLADLVADEMGDALERLAKNISYDLYLGDGSDADHMLGFCDVTNGALNATGTYAAVSRSSYPQWASNVAANGAVQRSLQIQLLRDLERLVYVASGRTMDAYVTDPFTFEQYGLLLGDKRRYLEDVTLSGRKVTLDGGFRALEFDGKPIFRDNDCPAGRILGLNTRFVSIQALPHAPGSMAPIEGQATPKGSEESQFGESSFQLPAKINFLAKTGDRVKFQIVVYPALVCKRPNTCGQIIDLRTS